MIGKSKQPPVSRSVIYASFCFVVIFLLLLWIERHPGVVNQNVATIRVYNEDSILYEWNNVRKGNFEYRIKDNPRTICVTVGDKHLTIPEKPDEQFIVYIDYLDDDLVDLDIH